MAKEQPKPKEVRRGRKSKYETHVLPRLTEIEGWARDGLIDEQIANNCGVAYSTFRVYKNQYPELAAALAKGKEVADYEVENALFKRATGYTVRLKKAKVLSDGTVVEYTEEVHYPPDTVAMICWLKNRRPDKWRDRQEIEQHNTGEINIVVKGV